MIHVLNILADATAPTLMDRLLGLRDVSWADADTVLSWRYLLPAWAWALIVLLALFIGGWSYSRLLGPRWMRLALAGVRSLLLILLAMLLAGPMLVREDVRIERDWLLVLVDRSASMQVRDLTDEHDQPLSRDQALRAALAEHHETFEAEALNQRRIAWLGFHGNTFEIDPPKDTGALPDADGQNTAIRTAMEQSLQFAAGRPIAGLVLLSDGRSPQSTGPELLHRLEQQAVNVFTVPIGSRTMPLDLFFEQVDAPQRAFTNDIVPVSVSVDALGDVDDLDLSRVRVRLIDTRGIQPPQLDEDFDPDDNELPEAQPLPGPGGEVVLDERTLDEAGGFGQPLRLTGRSESVGNVQWRVEVELIDTGDGLRELILDNNQRLINLELIDRPINVLYIEGYPRWEYRYLTSMLLREESISSSMYLLSADRDFAQEGDYPITRIPETREEISRYDVIILGDVPANAFTAEQYRLIRDHVALFGAGLLFIAGERSMPVSYENTPLADLLPMRRVGAVSRFRDDPSPLAMQPTPLARRLNIMSLRGLGLVDEDATQPEDWPGDLAGLLYAQQPGPLKPTAEVIARAAIHQGTDELPMLMRLRYGAGQSLYVGTDETWRWRYGRGELYYEQFWIQLVRMLGRARPDLADERAQLTISDRRATIDQTLVVELLVDDPALIDLQAQQITVQVVRVHNQEQRVVDELSLRPVLNADFAEDAPQRLYRATWRPSDSGTYLLRVTSPGFDALNLTRDVEVISPDDEMRNPQADYARMAMLAEQTGGAKLSLAELPRLPELLRDRSIREPNDVSEPIWNSALAMILITTLLTIEWVIRKLIRLA